VVLYDRPNSSDQVLGGTLSFSDGSTVAVGALTNSGSAVTVSFTPRSVTSVTFTVNSVSATTRNVGLAEIQVYGASSSDTTPPSVPGNLQVSGTTSSSASLLWTVSTDTGGSGLVGYRIYRGSTTTPLASVTGTSFTDTGLAASTSYSYRVTAYDGAANESAAAGPVTGTTQAASGSSSNIAPLATVTASSQNTSTGQSATKAVDGILDGYPGDYTREWATVGQGAGAWIRLAWGAPYTLDHVVLYDRPNSNDQVLGGTLSFSDGSTLVVGALTNSGSAVTVSFTPRSVTSVTFTVNSISATTQNIGLSEFQSYGGP
jgi:hypothetical protein